MKVNKKSTLLFLVSVILLFITLFAFYKGYSYVKYISGSPYDVLVSDVTSNSITISWKTDIDKPSFIKIGENIYGDETETTIHRIYLSDMQEFSDHKFVITDKEDSWDKSYKNSSNDIESLTLKSDFVFRTAKSTEDILLPLEEEVISSAYELEYLVLFDEESNTYSSVKSIYTNRFGGAVVNKNEFYNYEREMFITQYPNAQLRAVEYGQAKDSNESRFSLIPTVLASEINCNQQRADQSSNAINKNAYSTLATNWVAGRGKHYATECYNDVIYKAKAAGVDPAFALTIWMNESGASNYTQNQNLAGLIEDFGIHGRPSVPAQNFNSQIEFFLNLTHVASCPGLTYWESWGNMYRWGNCNEDDPVKRQQGIDYYKGINNVYSLVTNGKALPEKINGLPKEEGESDSSSGWEDPNGPLCCALKLDNKDNLIGDYENNKEGKTCSDVWKVGRSVRDGRIEYSVEIKDKVEGQCEVEYPGVCCTTQAGVFWYPESVCTNKISNINSAKECKEYSNVKACFLREGKYQWLPKAIGTDFVEGVTTETSCISRNSLATYKIKLVRGINLVGFDFTPTYQVGNLLASHLISQNSEVLLVGKFDDNTWSHLVKRSDTLPFAGEDFSLEQNNGYLIISESNIELSLGGWKDKSASYKDLSEGWNLVGGSIYTRSGSASKVLDSLSKNGLDVSTVSKWDVNLGRFNYRTEDKDLEEYGENFKILSTDGIFLRTSK